jgi:hypothetical protein
MRSSAGFNVTDTAPHVLWDRFIDDLDRAGQGGSAAHVPVPALAPDLPSGTAFGDLTREDLKNLARLANSLGRRADVVTTLWQDMDRKRKALLKAEKDKKKAR